MRLKEVLALLCVTTTCGAQKWKQEASKGQGSIGEGFSTRKKCLHLHFGINPDTLLLLMSVFSGIHQWQDVFESDPGTGQLEIRHCNPSERPAGQRPRLCPTWIQQVGLPIGLPLQSCRGAWTRKVNIKLLSKGAGKMCRNDISQYRR